MVIKQFKIEYKNELIAIESVLSTLRPPSRLTVSQWADQKRYLSPESSSEPGKYYCERCEYARGIMDSISDPSVEEVVIQSSSQISKTTILENFIGYFIDQDPAPILMIQPTIEMAKTFSSDRLAPMIRDNPCLTGKVHDVRERDSQNTILRKAYPGGFIAMAGANSAASLASRPVRVVLQDEVDRFPASAGKEGDPSDLADKRCVTFWNRKKVKTSTPTIKGISRIEKAYMESDQRRYWVPCTHCGEYQVLEWEQVKWPKDGEGSKKKHRPKEAYYECAGCGEHLTDADKLRMIREGEWRADGEFTGSAGFHLNELYSPWVSFAEIVKNFLQAKRGGKETLKVWINTSLGKTWEETGDTIQDAPLYNRREHYGPDIPERAGILTAAVDTQDDRLDVSVFAWGREAECWVIERRVLWGNTAENKVWNELDTYLAESFHHESGVNLYIKATMIDSGGHRTEMVYNFCKGKAHRNIFACKGSNQPAEPILGKPSRKNVAKVELYPIGTDTAKDMLYGRLTLEEPGPGFVHFPKEPWADEDYFRELTAETKRTRYKMGHPVREWELPPGRRNEALDGAVYNLGAIEYVASKFPRGLINWDNIFSMIEGGAKVEVAGSESRPAVVQLKPKRRMISGGIEI